MITGSTNFSEKSIKTWRFQFVGVMSGTTADLPAHLWCQTITQAERQLLLLRKSIVNRQISAYAHVYKRHDYNAAPFLPIGMDLLVHNKPKRRDVFVEHFSKGCVLGTEFEHYSSWIIWMKNTRAMRILATVLHKHKYTPNPDITPKERFISAEGK